MGLAKAGFYGHGQSAGWLLFVVFIG